MRDELLYYYERELAFLRRTGAEFARRYPKVAGRLMLEPTKCDDPHVERLLEGFAFLAARVHLKIDDDLPEISEALLDVVFPHYTRPVPAMSLVEFHLDPQQGNLNAGVHIPRDTLLLTRPVGGLACQFRTCYDSSLWPLRVAAAKWVSPHELSPPVRAQEAVAALRVELECFPGVTFAELALDRLRLHLSAEPNLASALYELLCNDCLRILVRDVAGGVAREPIVLEPSALQPVGFAEDEGMLPLARRAFLGYRLLQEYFTFPDKFLFLDLEGMDRACAAGFGSRVEVIFLIGSYPRPERRHMLETGLNREVIRLGAVPIINLFPQTAEPILLQQRQPEHLVVTDAQRRENIGIYSVDEVVAVTPEGVEPLRFEPLYSFRHGADGARPRLFWRASRRPAAWRLDEGTDVYLSFVDASSRTIHPDADVVTVRTTCHNGDLPSRLPFGDPRGDFEILASPVVHRVTTLVKPTTVIYPPLGKPQLWRLISQLSLNYVSLIEGGPQALQELLRLHNFAESSAAERQIQGIIGLKGSPSYARINSEHGLTFARGQRVEIEFDEEQFAGGSAYLLASVLERLMGLFVSLNSFSVLAMRTRQRGPWLKQWQPRSGWKTLL
ncbi:type VI secretion system baseplate subunit TssF [soil metagenome]|nr:type VI secretion system baseplate subunit TssF [Gemmatimonadota bacterium]